MSNKIFWKRIYEESKPEDGFRILIDRLWPRGITKEAAALGEWAKEITPSAELRKAYHRGEIPYAPFAARYVGGLAARAAGLQAKSRKKVIFPFLKNF